MTPAPKSQDNELEYSTKKENIVNLDQKGEVINDLFKKLFENDLQF